MAPWLHRCVFLVRYFWATPGIILVSARVLCELKLTSLRQQWEHSWRSWFSRYSGCLLHITYRNSLRVWRMNSNLFLLLCLWFFVWKKHRVCDAFHLCLLWFLLLVRPLYLVCKKPCLFPFEIVNSTRKYPQERATFFYGWGACLPQCLPAPTLPASYMGFTTRTSLFRDRKGERQWNLLFDFSSLSENTFS